MSLTFVLTVAVIGAGASWLGVWWEIRQVTKRANQYRSHDWMVSEQRERLKAASLPYRRKDR